jgi:phosphoglycerate dehydrogenase-like enzyme
VLAKGLIVQHDLFQALRHGVLAAAALDVSSASHPTPNCSPACRTSR